MPSTPGVVIERDISQGRPGQPAAPARLGELLVTPVSREVRRRVVERRQVSFGHEVHDRYDVTPMHYVVK